MWWVTQGEPLRSQAELAPGHRKLLAGVLWGWGSVWGDMQTEMPEGQALGGCTCSRKRANAGCRRVGCGGWSGQGVPGRRETGSRRETKRCRRALGGRGPFRWAEGAEVEGAAERVSQETSFSGIPERPMPRVPVSGTCPSKATVTSAMSPSTGSVSDQPGGMALVFTYTVPGASPAPASVPCSAPWVSGARVGLSRPWPEALPA